MMPFVILCTSHDTGWLPSLFDATAVVRNELQLMDLELQQGSLMRCSTVLLDGPPHGPAVGVLDVDRLSSTFN